MAKCQYKTGTGAQCSRVSVRRFRRVNCCAQHWAAANMRWSLNMPQLPSQSDAGSKQAT